jgi:hypothetical protein
LVRITSDLVTFAQRLGSRNLTLKSWGLFRFPPPAVRTKDVRRLAAGWIGFLLTAGLPLAAQADDITVRNGLTVVELFTSQGCSSCPPADRLLAEMADRTNIIALTFPVDYWDYLGWKDTLASNANTVRQKSYAATRGDGQIYTPQVVVNGLVHAVGSRPDQVDAALAQASAQVQPWQAPLTASIVKGVLSVSAGDTPNGQPVKGSVWIAEYRRSVAVAVKSGENSGSNLTYTNVVRRLAKVGNWDGKAHVFEMNLMDSAKQQDALAFDGCVVFLQEGVTGPIMAAVELRNWHMAY